MAPPHAGAGIELEWLAPLLLRLGNLRDVSLFPIEPKSFPADPPGAKFRHPEGNTLRRPTGHLPPLNPWSPVTEMLQIYRG
jgi:hypothetical protein